MVGGYESPSSETRYDAVGALGLTEQLNSGHVWFCAATLVGASTVLTARHCVTFYGTNSDYSVRFRRQVDGNVGSVESKPESFFHARVASWYLPPYGDSAIGTLSEPVVHIEPMAISYDGVMVGDSVTLAGWGREGPASDEGPMLGLKLCANKVKYVSEPTQAIVYSAWHVDGPGCGFNRNDSGGAVIVDGGRQPRIIGNASSKTSINLLWQYVVRAPEPVAELDVVLTEGAP